MKRLFVLLAVLFLTAGNAFAVESGSVPTSEMPEVVEKVGGDAIVLEAVYYPIITATDIESWENAIGPSCYVFLDRVKNGKVKIGDDIGIDPSLPGLIESSTGEKFNADFPSLQKVKDLDVEIKILPAHKKTAKVLVFWTLRVTGQCLPWRLDERVCRTFAATANYKCIGNNVHTYVKVNGKLRPESKCTLQIPEMTNKSNESALYDPTITGTYVITKDNFPETKELPDKLNIEIYWENEGAMRVGSPKGMRNLIVNTIPYTRSQN